MRHVTIALALTALATACPAPAQRPALSEGIRFALKPRPFRLIPEPEPADRVRISPIDPVSANDRSHELAITVRRQKLRLLHNRHGVDAPALDPRSRFILMTVEDRVPVGGTVTAIAGFQGMKLRNRDSNVTATGSGDRLRARDWFMPRATIEIAPAPAIDLALSYRESLWAYDNAGRAGPLGLSREAFRSFAMQLRPERRTRLRIDAGWKPSPDLSLSIAAYDGRIDDRLSFAERSYQPSNSGSAALHGASLALTHRLSSHWRWSMRYGAARVREAGGDRVRESSMTIETGWTHGRWNATLRGTKSGAPALRPEEERWRRRVRVEGEMRYDLPAIGNRPANISLRLTDPDQLVSTALLRDDPAGPARAVDQARGLMLGLGLGW